jgi:glycosyltransferase involved in cell wall biosynthesis
MDRKTRVLYITSLYIVPAYSGGPTRAYNIAKELAKETDLTLILPQSAASVFSDPVWGPALSSVRILGSDSRLNDRRTPIERWTGDIHERFRCWYWRKNPLRTVFMARQQWYGLIDEAFRTAPPDIVILEQSWHIETLRYVRRYYPGVPCILSAQNVKTTLFRQLSVSLHTEKQKARFLRRYIRWCDYMESSLYKFVDGIWACSTDDLQVFQKKNIRHPLPLTVVANGVDTAYFSFDGRPEKAQIPRIIYGGSLCWQPSAEAVAFFYRQVWPLIHAERPDLQLVILGREPPDWMYEMVKGDASVRLVGEVPDARPYFADASITVCPILSGSGTRLKILEAMSMGNPVVSTTLGAEGITATDGQELLITDSPAAMAAAVLRLASDSHIYNRLRRNGRAFVEKKYEWSQIIRPAVSSIINSLDSRK